MRLALVRFSLFACIIRPCFSWSGLAKAGALALALFISLSIPPPFSHFSLLSSYWSDLPFTPSPFIFLPWLLVALLSLSMPSLGPVVVGLRVGGPKKDPPPLGALEVSFFCPYCFMHVLACYYLVVCCMRILCDIFITC